jgi:hypothetical protein
VASLLAATSPGHIEQRRTPLRILAPEFVGTQRRCAPARQSPSPWVVGRHDSFRHGNRMPCQLA